MVMNRGLMGSEDAMSTIKREGLSMLVTVGQSNPKPDVDEDR